MPSNYTHQIGKAKKLHHKTNQNVRHLVMALPCVEKRKRPLLHTGKSFRISSPWEEKQRTNKKMDLRG